MTQLKYLVNTKNMCSLPWIDADVDLQNNRIKPCCKYQGSLGKVSDGFNVVWFNQQTSQLRTDFVNNVPRKECAKCTPDQDTYLYKDWKNILFNKAGLLDNIEVETPHLPRSLHVSLNNVCNLACRMCSPGSSSKINTLAQNIKFSKFFRPIAVDNKLSISHLGGSLKNLEYITIYGGEPLVNTDCLSLIELISKETQNLKFVGFVTNMTVVNKSLLEILASLNVNVRFNISIDGPQQIHEYIRVGCKWQDIIDNIKYIRSTYPTYQFAVNTTISALTVGYLHELLKELESIQKECDIKFVNMMPSPVLNDYLHVGVLPNEIKQLYKTRLINIDPGLFTIPHSRDLISTSLEFLEKDHTNNIGRFTEFTRTFDAEVNTDITSVYPEFNSLY